MAGVAGEAEVAEPVAAVRLGGGLSHLLHGGEEQGQHDGYDRDNDDQLDQGDAPRHPPPGVQHDCLVPGQTAEWVEHRLTDWRESRTVR